MKSRYELIKTECDKKNITIAKMCREIDINYMSFITNIKRKEVKAKTLLKISKYLNLDLEMLIVAPIEKKKGAV